MDLAIRRTGTFANRQIAMISTPTVAEVSRIEQAYMESDQRKYYLPVPALRDVADAALGAGEVAGPEAGRSMVRVRALPRPHRGPSQIRDAGAGGVARGSRRATATRPAFGSTDCIRRGRPGDALAKDFLRARKSPERMQTFTNTVLAETFQQAGATKTDASELLARREPYRADRVLPVGVVLITAGVDLQADRIEMEIVGWGRDEESWSLAYVVLPGDPAQRELWDMLRPGALADVRSSVRPGIEDGRGVRGLGVPSGDRAAVLQRAGGVHREDLSDQGRGGPAPDMAAHARARRRTGGRCGWWAWTPPRRRSTRG